MNKLLKLITAKGSELKLERGKRIVKGLGLAQDNIIGELEQEIGNLEDAIEAHMDLGMKHSTQLKFEVVEDSRKHMDALQALKVKLELKYRELEIAEATKVEYFSEPVELKKKRVASKKVTKVEETKEEGE